MARPATPTFDDYVPSPAHDDVRLAPTPIAPQPQPFSLLDIHPHPSHLASPQTPHLVPPLLSDPPALKHTRPVSPPPASPPPQHALRADGASPEPLAAHDATKREKKTPRLGNDARDASEVKHTKTTSVRSIEARQRRQANQNARRATKRAGEQAHEGP